MTNIWIWFTLNKVQFNVQGINKMRILFLGDVVGRSGRNAVINRLPGLIEQYQLDFVIVNGENAAGGFGITEAICNSILGAGADVITTGNHVWAQKEAFEFLPRQSAILRPLNYPQGTPGKGANIYVARNGAKILVINVMGQVFMNVLDDPFLAVQREIELHPLKKSVDAIVIDMHAEATSEKQGLAHFLDGRVSLVIGTHTHVPTADYQIFPYGTGFMSDSGMCGDYDSVIGMKKEEPVQRFGTKIAKSKYEPASGEATICGLAAEVDDDSGLPTKLEPLRLGGKLSNTLPSFWEE